MSATVPNSANNIPSSGGVTPPIGSSSGSNPTPTGPSSSPTPSGSQNALSAELEKMWILQADQNTIKDLKEKQKKGEKEAEAKKVQEIYTKYVKDAHKSATQFRAHLEKLGVWHQNAQLQSADFAKSAQYLGWVADELCAQTGGARLDLPALMDQITAQPQSTSLGLAMGAVDAQILSQQFGEGLLSQPWPAGVEPYLDAITQRFNQANPTSLSKLDVLLLLRMPQPPVSLLQAQREVDLILLGQQYPAEAQISQVNHDPDNTQFEAFKAYTASQGVDWSQLESHLDRAVALYNNHHPDQAMSKLAMTLMMAEEPHNIPDDVFNAWLSATGADEATMMQLAETTAAINQSHTEPLAPRQTQAATMAYATDIANQFSAAYPGQTISIVEVLIVLFKLHQSDKINQQESIMTALQARIVDAKSQIDKMNKAKDEALKAGMVAASVQVVVGALTFVSAAYQLNKVSKLRQPVKTEQKALDESRKLQGPQSTATINKADSTQADAVPDVNKTKTTDTSRTSNKDVDSSKPQPPPPPPLQVVQPEDAPPATNSAAPPLQVTNPSDAESAAVAGAADPKNGSNAQPNTKVDNKTAGQKSDNIQKNTLTEEQEKQYKANQHKLHDFKMQDIRNWGMLLDGINKMAEGSITYQKFKYEAAKTEADAMTEEFRLQGARQDTEIQREITTKQASQENSGQARDTARAAIEAQKDQQLAAARNMA